MKRLVLVNVDQNRKWGSKVNWWIKIQKLEESLFTEFWMADSFLTLTPNQQKWDFIEVMKFSLSDLLIFNIVILKSECWSIIPWWHTVTYSLFHWLTIDLLFYSLFNPNFLNYFFKGQSSYAAWITSSNPSERKVKKNQANPKTVWLHWWNLQQVKNHQNLKLMSCSSSPAFTTHLKRTSSQHNVKNKITNH